MGPSTVCNMPASRTRNTSVGGQFGFGIFEGIQRNTPVFIMNIQTPRRYILCYFVSG